MVSPWLEPPRRESPRKSTRTRTPQSRPRPLRLQHCGQFSFFRSSANTPTDNREGAAKNYVYFARKCAPFVFPQFSGSWKFPRQTFCRIPRTYGEGAHCYNIVTKLMQFSPQSNAVLLWLAYDQSTASLQVLEFTMHLTTAMWSQSNDRVRNLLRLPPLCLKPPMLQSSYNRQLEAKIFTLYCLLQCLCGKKVGNPQAKPSKRLAWHIVIF